MIALSKQADGGYDLSLTAGALAIDTTPATEIHVRLLTDVRVDDERGYWGDYVIAGDTPIGSKIWTLTKRDSKSMQLARSYIDSALAGLDANTDEVLSISKDVLLAEVEVPIDG